MSFSLAGLLKKKMLRGCTTTLHVVALRNIKGGEELFLNYGIKYSLKMSSIRGLYTKRIKWKDGKPVCMKATIATEN